MPRPYFTHLELDMKRIPAYMREACAQQGDCTENVQAAVKQLDFTAPQEEAREYIIATGGWTREEVNTKDDTEVNEIIFWLACCEYKETKERYFYLGV